MRSHRLLAAALAAVMGACAPATAGPEVPRPLGTSDKATTTTVPRTTITTVDPADLMAQTCPTEFCLVYEIAPGVRWSNGSPVTVEDFAHTARLASNPLLHTPTEGYRLIDAIEPIDGSRFRVVFSRPFGDWQLLFDRVVPAVSGDSHDLATMPTSGAFRLVERVPGDRIVIRRDPAWWSLVEPITGFPRGTIEEVTFVFPPDTATMLDGLENGEIDVVSLRPDVEAAQRIAGMAGVSHSLAPGPYWEHIDFNHSDPLLAQPWLRQAIALAIDREAVLEATIRRLDPAAEGLGNTVWMGNSVNYEQHYTHHHDPDEARAVLAENGCAPGNDGVQVCGEIRLSLLWASTDDDPARVEAFSLIREQLDAVGIEVVAAFRSPSAFVNRDFLFGGPEAWQIIEFAWRAAPDPASQNPVYYCGDTVLNVNRFCSEEVTALIRSTDTIADPAERAAVYNQADRLYLEAFPLIPLYQKPVAMAWRNDVGGPRPNWSGSTDMWNLAGWFGPRSIVVALPSEPLALDPLSWSDESANAVIASLLYGAFGMAPDHAYHPVLVSSVSVVEGPD